MVADASIGSVDILNLFLRGEDDILNELEASIYKIEAMIKSDYIDSWGLWGLKWMSQCEAFRDSKFFDFDPKIEFSTKVIREFYGADWEMTASRTLLRVAFINLSLDD